MGVQNFLLAKGTNYATKLASQVQGEKGSSFLQQKAIAMSVGKKMICDADPSAMKQRLKMALDYLPDTTIAQMIKTSGFCTTGGTRKTRKQKHNHKRKVRKTRKH
jgi:hypothetical protein